MKSIANKTNTIELIEKYDLNALKKYGQNFLVDQNVIDKIIDVSNINKETVVIEIGTGLGALTQSLSNYAKKVISYEIDERFKEEHSSMLNKDNIEIRYIDFLKTDLKQETKNIKENIVVVANLPYYITTNIIEKIILEDIKITRMVFMVQKEVALKFTQEYMNPLILTIKNSGKINYEFTVSKNVFIPAPNVDSAIISIKKEKPTNIDLYKLLTHAFKQRRKTLHNNLKEYYNDIDAILNKININPSSRAEELSLEQFNKILEVINNED